MQRDNFIVRSICSIGRAGFTLMEVAIVLAIIGVLATFALPSFQGITHRSQGTAAVNDLVSSFNFARNEAITRSRLVTVCKSNDLLTCDTSATGWQQGWLVYFENDAGNMEILRANNGIRGNVDIVGNFNVRNRIRYAASGFMPGLSNGTIIAQAGGRQIDIVISNTGRIRTVHP